MMKTKGVLISIFVLLTVTAVYCIERPEFTRETYPKVDGSTATVHMSQQFAMSLLGLNSVEAGLYIVHNKTYTAYENLLAGNADIIFVSEPPPEVYEAAASLGFELEVTPFARDAFVFITNIENSVESLTIEQIQKIYTGNIINWSELGGSDLSIIAFQRNEDSGSQTIMRQVVMKGLEMMPAQIEETSLGMGDIIDQVAEYDNAHNAIGYSIYYFETFMHPNPEVKLIAVNSITPNDQTIRDASYPYTGDAVAIIRSTEEENSPVRQLLNWILGPEGQDAVEKGGFVRIH